MDPPGLADEQRLTCISSMKTLDDLLGAIDDMDGWRERERERTPCYHKMMMICLSTDYEDL